MKLILFFVISCLALHNGMGVPRTAVYKFVKCNPDGDQANCVTQRSEEMPWSPDLPAKLPASATQYLEAEPVEDESPLWEEEDEEDEEDEVEEEEEEDEEEEEEEESQMTSEDRESPVVPEEGSGMYEGSGADPASMGETGSGESWTEEDKEPFRGGSDTRSMRRLFPSLLDEAKPAEHEMKEDHLLQP